MMVLNIPVKYSSATLVEFERVCRELRNHRDANLNLQNVDRSEIVQVFDEAKADTRQVILSVYLPGFEQEITKVMNFIRDHLPVELVQSKVRAKLEELREGIYTRSQ
jgi:hypothetical protein